MATILAGIMYYFINPTKDAGMVEVEDDGHTTFAAPFAEAGPAVLHLKREGS